MSIIIFLIILGVLIVAHEAGHFFVAKFFGIRVDEFAFGFPPRLFGIKKGETEYAINAVPFGGYVKIFGEDGSDGSLSEDEKKVSFAHKPRYIQAFVIVAGVLANFLLGWVLITSGYLIGLPTPATGGPEGSLVTDTHLVITSVRPDSPASKAGLLAGDRIISLMQGENIINENIQPSDVSNFISKTEGETFSLGLDRGSGASSTIMLKGEEGITTGRFAIGITMDSIGVVRLPFFRAVAEGFKTTLLLTQSTISGLVQLVRDIFKGSAGLDSVSGPVGIVGLVGDAKTLGFAFLISLTAIISINLAVINLVPFPALDGGRLLFIIIESIIRRPISKKVTTYVNTIGFIILLTLMLVISISDISKIL